MDTKALRQKILDLAIRGKLVPQDPNDEPASVLLERIRAEKQQMVKEGRLKAKDIKNDTIIFRGEDNLHYEKFADGSVKCIEDEIPFEVPEGWAWCRLGSVSSAIQYGLSNSAKTQGTHRLLRITDIQNGKVNWENVPFTTVEEPTAFLLTKGDIVFARSGSTVGKSFLIKEIPYPAVYASYLIKIQLLGNLRSDYIYQFFNSECYWEQITDKSVGVGQPNCNGSSLKELFIPLPPINEQDQIAVAADKYLKYADEIEEDKKALASLVSMTKSKILNLAIQGKLVPQDENDEPASVLLKRIRTEKDELIKTGKIKRDKKESIIFRGDDNSYYESVGKNNCKIDNEYQTPLPDGWEYARLKSICTKIIDGSHNPPKSQASKSDYIMASSRNINHDTFVELDQVRYISKEDYEKENERTFIKENDILLTTVGSLGRSCIYQKFPSNLCVQRSITIISTLILPEYLKMYFDSPKFQEIIVTEATGTAQKGFYLNQLENVIIPIPPLTEQYAMTSYVQCLMFNIDQIYHMVRE